MEMVKEIPGYKIILKAILKDQIQLLVEQLALHAQEESIILTASVSDDSISHLGSRLGRQFLERHGDIKSQFLGFCLRSSHQALQQQHLQQREAYVYHNSTLSQPSQVEDIHPARHSPKIRHEPYSTKRPSKRSPDKIQNTTCESSPEIILAFSEHDNVTNVKSENYGFENPGLIEIKSREQVENEKRDQLDTESRGHDEIESRGQVDTKGRGQLDNDTEGRGQVDTEPRGQIEIKGREQVDTESMSKVESISDIQLERSMKPHIKSETEEHLRMKGDYSINEPVFRLGLQDATSGEVIEVNDDSSREQVSPDCHDTSGFSTDSEVLVKIETDEEAWSEPGNSAFSLFGNFGMAARGKHGQNLELVSGQVVGEGQAPVRVHICDLCGKPFPSKWELGRHRRTHTGERPYHCHYCEKSFSDKSNMNQHIRGVHLRQPFRRDRTYRGERLQDKFDERDPY